MMEIGLGIHVFVDCFKPKTWKAGHDDGRCRVRVGSLIRQPALRLDDYAARCRADRALRRDAGTESDAPSRRPRQDYRFRPMDRISVDVELEAIVTAVPGPRSRALAEALRRHEARGVTYVNAQPNPLIERFCSVPYRLR